MSAKSSFYLVRHGETIANFEEWRSGSIDTELTEKGRVQARDIGRHLLEMSLPLTSIISSHLGRAVETAEIINGYFALPRHIVPDLAEQDYGDWAGRPYIETPNHHLTDPPNGETHKLFRERVLRGVEAALALDPGGMPLVVCHGGVMRNFSRHHGHELGKTKNCEVYKVEIANAASLSCINLPD